VFLFVKAKYFCYSLFDLSIEIYLLCFNRLLVGRRGYFVFLAIVAGLVLTGIFRVVSILGIGNRYIITRLTIEINRFLITGARGHLVSVLFNIVS
jgi:hypothetical protein